MPGAPMRADLYLPEGPFGPRRRTSVQKKSHWVDAVCCVSHIQSELALYVISRVRSWNRSIAEKGLRLN